MSKIKYSVVNVEANEHDCSCLVIGVGTNDSMGRQAAIVNAAMTPPVDALLDQGDSTGKAGSHTLIFDPAGIAAKRVLVLGMGEANRQDINKLAGVLSSIIKNAKYKDMTIALECDVQALVLALEARLYHYDHTLSEKTDPLHLKHITILTADSNAQTMLDQALAISDGVNTARELGNLPGNICTPAYLAKTARKLGKKQDTLSVEVLNESDMKKLKMGALLSVSQGSKQGAKLIVMHYQGGNAGDKPVVLVGKGVTFDSGGISIKPGAAMDEMKFDMCGAASVIGTMQAVTTLNLPINVVGIVPATENLPSGKATKPGDVVTSMAGKTIEVLNTDAEGRLILCDALTYAERFSPDAVIDIATLTGACVIALGRHATGMLANDDALAGKLEQAGQDSGDRVWRLPLWSEYDEQLASNFADMANIGGREAGTITAGCFLARFTKDYRWAHLDIAGTAWESGKQKGATGKPVRLLMAYLLGRLG
jgi:leucyl aminopeptidase